MPSELERQAQLGAADDTTLPMQVGPNERLTVSIGGNLAGTTTIQRNFFSNDPDDLRWYNWIDITDTDEADAIAGTQFWVRLKVTAYTSGAGPALIKKSGVRTST